VSAWRWGLREEVLRGEREGKRKQQKQAGEDTLATFFLLIYCLLNQTVDQKVKEEVDSGVTW
jgi:hypothetical protein